MIWTVGSVPGNLELKCLEELKENGIQAFVPLAKRWTKPARKNKPVLTTVKLFPGYIFVKISSNPDFQFIRLKKCKLSLLYTYDKEGNPKVSELKDEIILDILQRSEVGDLFDDFDKNLLRKSLEKNQLVCWRNGTVFSLGFVAKNTQGKPHAHVKIADGKELKISVALLSLL